MNYQNSSTTSECTAAEATGGGGVETSMCLLLWMLYVFSVLCYAFVRVCLYVPCGHLLEKG